MALVICAGDCSSIAIDNDKSRSIRGYHCGRMSRGVIPCSTCRPVCGRLWVITLAVAL